MVIHKTQLRIIVAQSSYRLANRIRQILVYDGYERNNIFEVISGCRTPSSPGRGATRPPEETEADA